MRPRVRPVADGFVCLLGTGCVCCSVSTFEVDFVLTVSRGHSTQGRKEGTQDASAQKQIAEAYQQFCFATRLGRHRHIMTHALFSEKSR